MKSKIFKQYNVVGDDLCYHHTVTEASGKEYYHGPEAHQQFEVHFLLGGEVSYIIDGDTYDVKEGDMIFVAPNEIHALVIGGDKPYERVVLLFNMDILHQMMVELDATLGAFSYDGKNRFHLIGRADVKKYGLDKLLLSIINEEGVESHKKLGIISRLLRFIIAIDNVIKDSKDNFATPTASDRLVASLTEYVDEHISEPIRLDKLAEVLYVSKSTLCHRFSSLMNMTVNQYIIAKKMYRAAELLREGKSAQATAEAVGYDNYTSFFYNYKRIMGTSPTSSGNGD
ncbi:MAG: AraC family transcriptional regulator [Clostridia bacterium]|nr:AraC family transcriptional regulator [Clostridia bacterium]